MRIQYTLCIFAFFFIGSDDVYAMDLTNKEKKFVNIYSKEIIDNAENEKITFEKASEYEEEVITEKRSFLIKLEETIKNCPNSMCSEYKCFNNDKSYLMDVRFNCEEFALATFFHTTATKLEQDKKCSLENIISSTKLDSIITKPTENLTIFVDAMSHKRMENKMCLIYLGGPCDHAMTLEVRKHGFYIYNSWKNSFSNSWFSGLTKNNKFDLRFHEYEAKFGSEKCLTKKDGENCYLSLINMFHEYKAKCGLGKCLTKKDVENCLIHLGKIFKIVGGDVYKEEKMSFEFACKELNEDFKILVD